MEAAHENEIENEASSSSPQPSPLFPVQSSSDPKVLKAAGHTPWLSNTSFDSIILPTSTTSSATPPSDWYGALLEENEGTARKASLEEPSYPILGSPTSEGIEEFPEESRKRAKRSKLEKKKERGKDGDRSSKVSARANSEGKLAKDYYFDTHGDRDNFAFGSLYRLDVARYRPHRLMEELHLPDYVSSYKGEKVITILDPEGDSISLDDKAREEGRYWSARFVSIERRKDLKRIHAISSGKHMYFPSEDFIPLQQEPVKDQRSELESASNMECGETWDEFFMRRTREFNKMTRDRPHDESLWIAFAIFQEKGNTSTCIKLAGIWRIFLPGLHCISIKKCPVLLRISYLQDAISRMITPNLHLSFHPQPLDSAPVPVFSHNVAPGPLIKHCLSSKL